MRGFGIFGLVAAIGMLAVSVPEAGARGCDQPAQAAALERELLVWINAERAAHGLRPYARSGRLDRAAAQHACDMATRNYFNHSRPGGPKLGTRIKATGYKLKAGDENIAYSRQAAVASAATIWRNSPPHWAAILEPTMKDIGISITTGDGKIYWVMDVARQKGG